jgi:hypothetical protein
MNDGGKIYKYLSLGFIILVGLILIWQPLMATRIHEDFNYHLMVAQNYERAGGVTTWAFWESLPGGRPQNYPPLFHLLLTPFVKAGLEPETITFYIPILFIVLNLLLGWFGIKLLFGRRTAFFFVIVAISYINYLIGLGVIIPSSLILLASPLLIYLVSNGRWLGSGLLIAMMFYTHVAMPIFVVSSLLIWCLFNRKHWPGVVTAILIATLLYLPWGLNVLINRHHITYLDPTYSILRPSSILNIPIIHLLALIVSLLYLRFNTAIRHRRYLIFFGLMFILQLPILFYKFPTRFTIGVGFMVAAILIAYALDRWWQKGDRSPWLRFGIITFVLLLPFINLELSASQSRLMILNMHYGIYTEAIRLSKLEPSSLVFHPYSTENLKLTSAIKNNSDQDDLIYNTTSFFSLRHYTPDTEYLIPQFFSALTNRAKINARIPEVFWHEPLPLENARIVIADYHQTDLFPGQPKEHQTIPNLATRLSANFEPVHQEDRLVIYRNLSDEVEKVKPPKPIVKLWLAWLVIIITLSLICHETILAHRRDKTKVQPSKKSTDRGSPLVLTIRE